MTSRFTWPVRFALALALALIALAAAPARPEPAAISSHELPQGLESVLFPGVLVCGVLARFGWRRSEWLFWLPGVVVIATLAQPLLPARSTLGGLDSIDVLMLGVTMVAGVRALALRRRMLPRTPVDRLALALLLLGALALRVEPRGAAGVLEFRHLVTALLVFYAAAAVSGRPGGARWVWAAYPLALALLGAHALWAFGHGAAVLRAHARAADVSWHSQEGLLVTLLTALPVGIGLATDAAHRGARRAWQAAVVLGAAGIALHVATVGPLDARAAVTRPAPLQWGMLAVAGLTFAALARMAWGLAAARPAESPRWIAAALTCLALPLLALMGLPSSGTTAMLLTAIGGGLVVGTRRALERDARRPAPGDAAETPGPLAEAA